MDIYRDAKHRGIYPPLFTDPEGDSCFSIYQIRWIKKCCFINGHNFFFWNFREMTCHVSLHSQNSEHPRIFQVTGANQNAWKLLSTDLVKLLSLDSPYSMDSDLPAQWHNPIFEQLCLSWYCALESLVETNRILEPKFASWFMIIWTKSDLTIKNRHSQETNIQ